MANKYDGVMKHDDKLVDAFEEFLKCLDEKRFYDAHEILEAVWFPLRFEANSEVKLLKGFINAAVSFELIKKKRYTSAKKVWNNYLKYRPLLYKINSPYLNNYHQLARHVETVNNQLFATISKK